MVESNWLPPTEFPDLRSANIISLDVETYDPRLIEDGPGDKRKDGYIVGLSVATDYGFNAYYPVRHEGGGNCENIDMVKAWAKDQLSTDIDKTGANLSYDTNWLMSDWGIRVGGRKLDVQIAEPLIDETKYTYTLDSLAEQYLGLHKEENLMTKASVELFGLKAKTDKALEKLVKKNLWRLPAKYVGPYGEADTTLPIKILNKQIEILKEQDLWDLFINTEVPMVDLLFEMRQQGVPVDLNRAEDAAIKLEKQLGVIRRKIKRRVGFDPNIWAPEDLVKCCDKLGIPFLRTEKGNPSFEAEWLEESTHEFLGFVSKARKLDRGGSVFIRSKIINLAVNGRIYPSFQQVKSDRGGTVSGRFASSNPNMQQVPARDPEISPLIRSCFIPDKGKKWGVFDYSQQEPRVLLHYACLCDFRGAAEAREAYINDPSTDYHQLVADMANIERKPAKTINLGLSYGMGQKKLAAKLGISLPDAKLLINKYYRALPFVMLLNDLCMAKAKRRGYVRTLLGRRRRFNLYGPPKWKKGLVPLHYDKAIEAFGKPVQLYFIHKTMNALVQGSSADMTKQAMLQCWKNLGIVPYITIHDEIDPPVESLDQARKIRDTMLHCIDISVPLKVDVELGPSWGEAKEVDLDAA